MYAPLLDLSSPKAKALASAGAFTFWSALVRVTRASSRDVFGQELVDPLVFVFA